MLFSKLSKIMVNKVTFVGFRGAIVPPRIRPSARVFQLDKDAGANPANNVGV